MKQLPSFISDADPVSYLESELGLIDRQMRDVARTGNETALVSLRDRKAELPELIQKARMKDFASRLSVARSRVAAFDIELQIAYRRAGTLSSQVEPKIAALQAEIERLRTEWAQAVADKESLQFAAKQARDDLDRIQNERETLLLGHYGT
jgi:chromosome segregation ATPase